MVPIMQSRCLNWSIACESDIPSSISMPTISACRKFFAMRWPFLKMIGDQVRFVMTFTRSVNSPDAVAKCECFLGSKDSVDFESEIFTKETLPFRFLVAFASDLCK